MRRRTTRGTSLLAVLGVLALLAMVMAVLARLLMTNLGETRRRANAQYAAELAHSGIDWARASLVARASFERKVLKVRGGEIDIHVVVHEGTVRIVSAGRVVEDGAVLTSREEILSLGPVERVEETPPLE